MFWDSYSQLYCLNYKSEVGGHGFDDSLQIPRHERLIEAYSDISFAPGGNRSCQGVIVLFAGSPVNGKRIDNPFALCQQLSQN